ncbi:hypothetical protein CONCODRAFT_5397 [Conidiobolus coronatus NRRL 28638]|uniref:G-protein coupled receptors family 1 profile domain-containing protein n=1 Tax=Conidiobolus coronatus (strain ATCC 28846 / CBS 209.66 / NRRL 28638) TaxID=796925 RepID=A0A137PA94_CONC2|nr:hypothetical protein CONCODRAFT_5397 [Conidiobolus coronatus NRRL 28638]|eukprot:KXN71872.1 hypothetical protein CONCODRAFT_5397 [Conidiobolus coronatus NRRL 28638]
MIELKDNFEPIQFNRVSEAVDIIDMIISSISLCGNFLLIYICQKRYLQKGPDLIIAQLIALIDILFACVMIAFQVLKSTYGLDYLLRNPFKCQIDGLLLVSCVISSVSLVGVLAVLRYLAICKEKKLNTYFWIPLAILVVAGCFTGIGMGAYFSAFTVMPTGTYCMVYLLTNTYSKILILVLLCYALCVVACVLWCYTMITFKYWRLTKDLYRQHQFASDVHYTKAMRHQRVLIIGKIGFMVSLYCLQLSPNLVAIIADLFFNVGRPQWVDAFASIMIHSVTCTNPMFVLFLHEETKQELIQYVEVTYSTLKIRVGKMWKS